MDKEAAPILKNVLTVDELIAALTAFRDDHGGGRYVRTEGCDCDGWATGTRRAPPEYEKCWVRNGAPEEHHAQVIVGPVFYISRNDDLPYASEHS